MSAMTNHGAVSIQHPIIVVVDDDPAVRNSLKFSLEIEGFTVRLYRDGGELLTDADLPSQGCLIIDYRMPGMNGLELLEKLRNRRVLMPAIIITSGPSPALRTRAGAVGAYVVEKPFLGNALLDGIRAAFEDRPSPA